jgi:hypothetical protein
MKARFSLPMPVMLLTALASPVGGDPVPQPQIEFSKGLQRTFNADWDGVAGRTYFTQFSLDLQTWHYAPYIDFGEGEHRRGIESSSDKIFLRLNYGEFPGISSLDQAMNADFDGDGLSNLFEVRAGYDPFEAISTVDGPDGSADPDQDGLVNLYEQAVGLDPMSKDHPAVKLSVIIF